MTNRVDPLPRGSLGGLEEGFKDIEVLLGFVPNSSLIMARHPQLLMAFQQLAVAALTTRKVDRMLKVLVGHMASRASGCGYCIAHTGHTLEAIGLSEKKFQAIWSFETDPQFTKAERAALRLAMGAAQVPNGVTDDDFLDLKKYFDEDQIVELLGVISLYGFLNRWNDTLATELENSPLNFAEKQLLGMKIGYQKHVGTHEL